MQKCPSRHPPRCWILAPAVFIVCVRRAGRPGVLARPRLRCRPGLVGPFRSPHAARTRADEKNHLVCRSSFVSRENPQIIFRVLNKLLYFDIRLRGGRACFVLRGHVGSPPPWKQRVLSRGRGESASSQVLPPPRDRRPGVTKGYGAGQRAGGGGVRAGALGSGTPCVVCRTCSPSTQGAVDSDFCSVAQTPARSHRMCPDLDCAGCRHPRRSRHCRGGSPLFRGLLGPPAHVGQEQREGRPSLPACLLGAPALSGVQPADFCVPSVAPLVAQPAPHKVVLG